MKKEQKQNDVMVIKGLTIVSAKYGIKKIKSKSGKEYTSDVPLYQLSFRGNIPYEDITAYDDAPDKWVPTWYKDADGYMNLSSQFDIAFQIEGQRSTMSEFLEDAAEKGYSCTGSVADVKIRQTDGAVYPVAVKVLSLGEERDPFDDM